MFARQTRRDVTLSVGGGAENAGVENAGCENAGVDSRVVRPTN